MGFKFYSKSIPGDTDYKLPNEIKVLIESMTIDQKLNLKTLLQKGYDLDTSLRLITEEGIEF